MKKIETAEMLKINTMPYACYVIQERALPHLNDGLKPSQRRVLYTMYRHNTLWNKPRVKCYNIEGKTMEIHPHGGTYQTIARLARGDSMNIPLVDPKGTMGIHNSEEIVESSARYTEGRLAPITQEFFRNINKEAVPFVDNYDGTIKEPMYLPVTYPAILCNVQIGIAVGFSSSICPFSFEDVCNNTIKYLRGEEMDILVPDFGTGGYLVKDDNTFKKIHEEGLGTLKQRGKYKVEGNSIVFYELPYMSTVEKITDQIVNGVKAGTLKEIEDANNFTGKNGLNLTIDVKKNTNIEKLIEKLYKTTDLENSFSCNFTIIYNDRPVVMGVRDIIKNWCDFRINTAKNISNYEIDNLKSEIHLLEGMELIINDLDETIKIIRFSEDDEDSLNKLIDKFNLTRTQAEYISNKTIKSLNKKSILNHISKLQTLRNRLSDLIDLVNNEDRIKNIIIKQLSKLILDYPYQRKTELIEKRNCNIEEIEVEDYNVQFTLTKDGYFKKIRLTSLRGNNTHRLKDGDEVKTERVSNNRTDLLIFTDKQNCYKLKANDLGDHKTSNLGVYLPSHIQLEEDESVVDVIPTIDYSEHMIVAFDSGRVVRLPLKSYETKTNRTRLVKALHTDKVIGMFILNKEGNYALKSANNRLLIFNTADISLKTSRNSQGVIIMSHKDIEVIGIKPVEECNLHSIKYYATGKAGKGILLGDEF